MKPLFVDAGYLVALLDPRDQFHSLAAKYDLACAALVTTDMVLTELLNSMAKGRRREAAARYALNWLRSPMVRVIHHDHQRYSAAVDFYFERLDKHWSLTDCASFLIMNRLGIQDALTADRHFGQAGYNALLLRD